MFTALILIGLIGAIFTALEMRATLQYLNTELDTERDDSLELRLERDTLQSQLDHLHGELIPKMQSEIDDLTVELESKIDMLSFVDNMNQRLTAELLESESKLEGSKEQGDIVLSTIEEIRNTLDELECEIA